jgi:hypothetical protein
MWHRAAYYRRDATFTRFLVRQKCRAGLGGRSRRGRWNFEESKSPAMAAVAFVAVVVGWVAGAVVAIAVGEAA